MWWSLGAGALVIVVIAALVMLTGQSTGLAGSGGLSSPDSQDECYYLDENNEPVYFECEGESESSSTTTTSSSSSSEAGGSSDSSRSAVPGCPYTIDFVAEPCGKCTSDSVVGHGWDPEGTSCVVQAEGRGEGATVCFPSLGAIYYAVNEAARLAGDYKALGTTFSDGFTCASITGETLPQFFAAFVPTD